MRKQGRRNKDRISYLMLLSIKLEDGLLFRKPNTILKSGNVKFHYVMDEEDSIEVGIHITDVKIFNSILSNQNGELTHLKNSLRFLDLDCFISLEDKVLLDKALNSENWDIRQKANLNKRTFQISKSIITREIEEYTPI